MPTRGFGDLYYKQKRDEEGNLKSPGEQVLTPHQDYFLPAARGGIIVFFMYNLPAGLKI